MAKCEDNGLEETLAASEAGGVGAALEGGEERGGQARTTFTSAPPRREWVSATEGRSLGANLQWMDGGQEKRGPPEKTVPVEELVPPYMV